MTLKDALDQTVPQKAAFSEIGEKFIGAEYNMVRLVVWSCSKIISNELVNLIACLYTSHYQSFQLTVGLSPRSQPKCLKYFATPVMRVYVRNFHPIGWSRLSTDKTRSFLVNPAQLTFPSILYVWYPDESYIMSTHRYEWKKFKVSSILKFSHVQLVLRGFIVWRWELKLGWITIITNKQYMNSWCIDNCACLTSPHCLVIV